MPGDQGNKDYHNKIKWGKYKIYGNVTNSNPRLETKAKITQKLHLWAKVRKTILATN